MRIVAAIVVSFAASAGCIVAGTYLLAGTGWAAIAGGVALLIVAGALARGLRNG